MLFRSTDDGCDFGFYDHLGLERIVSREAAVCRETPRRDDATTTNKTGDVPFCAYLYGAWLGDKDDAH